MTTTTDRPHPRTAAALAARRRNTQAALERVHEAITRLRRDKTPVTVAAVARRADVSRTFLYTNPDAKTAVAEAIRRDRRPTRPPPRRAGRRRCGELARTCAQRRARAQDRQPRDHDPADTDR